MGDLVVGIGSSDEKDSATAGKEAAISALSVFKDQSPDVAIVFASQRLRYQELLGGIQSVIGDVPLVGGTTAGEISTHFVDEHFDSITGCLDIDDEALRPLALAGAIYEYRRAKKRAAAPATGERRNLNWKVTGRRLSLRSFPRVG